MSKLLLTLRDKDIFPREMVSPEPKTYIKKIRVKGIIFDENKKIALVGVKNRLLPGGEVELNETLEEALKRECLEEMGCDIAVESEIGFSNEYRAKRERQQEIHFFIGRVIGEKGIPTTTQEDEEGMIVDWHTPEEALKILEEQTKTIPFEGYNSCFNVRAHLFFLREYYKK